MNAELNLWVFIVKQGYNNQHLKTWDSHSSVVEDSGLLGCDAFSMGELILIFCYNVRNHAPTVTASHFIRHESKLYSNPLKWSLIACFC